MPTATLTSKGQITIPAELRTRLHLKPGDQLDFWEDDTSNLRLTPKTRRLADFFGSLRGDANPLTIEDMDDVIGAAATKAALQ